MGLIRKKFREQSAYSDSHGPLESWYEETIKAHWASPQAIKRPFGSASICGNKYRLIVEVQYQAQIIWVKFIGTHAQYDEVNVENINEY